MGGLLSLPVTVPVNLAIVMYLQLQMVAAIASLGGHDVRNDRVRALCYACLCGNAAADVLKGAGITIGKKLTEHAIKQLPFEVIRRRTLAAPTSLTRASCSLLTCPSMQRARWSSNLWSPKLKALPNSYGSGIAHNPHALQTAPRAYADRLQLFAPRLRGGIAAERAGGSG